MKSYLPYLQNFPDEPAETYNERRAAMLRQAIVDHPEDELQLLHQLIIFVAVTEHKDELPVLAERLLTLDTEKKFTADVFIILARYYNEKKETSKSIEYYLKTLDVSNDFEEAIIELGEVYEKSSDFDHALKIYEMLDNKNIEFGKEDRYRFQGNVYIQKKDFDSALECFKKALDIYPGDEDGWITDSIGRTYWHKKDFIEAMKWFKILLDKNPDSIDGHYGMGLCYQDLGDVYRAMHHYTEALKTKPDFAEVYNNIAALMINFEGEMKKGIEMLEKAIANASVETNISLFYLNLSRVYSKIADYDKADYYKTKYMESFGFDVDFETDDDGEEA